KQEIRTDVERLFGRYPTARDLQSDDPRLHVPYYSFVHPQFGTFVFTETGKLVGCLEFRDEDVSSLKREVTGASSSMMMFVLNRGTQTIRIENLDKEIVGDIYLREDTGHWVYRIFEQQLNQVYQHCQIEDNTVRNLIKNVLNRAWRLSLDRVGAIL